MQLAQLIESMSQPGAYSEQVATVEVCHTHISVVFLCGQHVYKVKKPVNLGFLDFSTLANRRHYCEEEVRLNRRLAPKVYLGVVPICRRNGGLKIEGDGEAVEWAVKMQRLPDEATLRSRLQHGQVGSDAIATIARRIAVFHDQAESSPHIAAFGRFEVVARNVRENFVQSGDQVGATVSKSVFARLQDLTERSLARHASLIESRAERGVPRDTHGDLRLSHVYCFPERESPDDLVIIDCIEFNERFRFADPVSDLAFLYMGLSMHGRRDLAKVLAEECFRAKGDAEGRQLLPFYVAYRAAVRGKVEGMKSARSEVPQADRAIALCKARGSWLLALGEIEIPQRKPCLVLVAGLPGTGKSTLARSLAQHAGFQVIRSDSVRKELSGASEACSSDYRQGIYTQQWTDRTYAECLSRAEQLLFAGQRVLVDANFREEAHRRQFLEAATRWGVPGILLLCEVSASIVRERLGKRRDDVSDADWSIYLRAAETWEQPDSATNAVVHCINTEGSEEKSLEDARAVLRSLDLDRLVEARRKLEPQVQQG